MQKVAISKGISDLGRRRSKRAEWMCEDHSLHLAGNGAAGRYNTVEQKLQQAGKQSEKATSGLIMRVHRCPRALHSDVILVYIFEHFIWMPQFVTELCLEAITLVT